MPLRSQIEPTNDWHQIALVARAPGQRTYELIRPVVLFGQSPAEPAAETGAAPRTARDRAVLDSSRAGRRLGPPQTAGVGCVPA